MEAFTRTAQASETAVTGSATVQIAPGVWEIVSMSVILGGTTPVVTVIPVQATGDVRFEAPNQQDGSTEALAQSQRLMAGTCTLLRPLVLEGNALVIGPGQIKSYMQHTESVEHTLTVTYRRWYA